ncbi:MAG: Zn-binding domain-containing protein [Candidatus Krumholzibacteriia bacterium]
MRELTHGTDGPNAVIATTLHELLPEERRKVLAFADGRQEAAFFAWYMEDTYEAIRSRVLVLRALRGIVETGADEAGLHDLAVEVRELLKRENGTRPLTDREWLQKAWQHVFRELLTDQRRISLEGVGLVRWFPILPPDLELPASLRRPPWNLGKDEARAMVSFLLDTMRTDCSVELETDDSVRVQWDDLKLRAHQTQMEIGRAGAIKIKAWDGSGTRRVVFLARWLERHGQSGTTREARIGAAQDVLREIWEAVSRYAGPPRMLLPARCGRRAHPRWWRGRLLQSGDPLFQCDTCGRLQALSIGELCARHGCPGTLSRVDPTRIASDDHYRVLYEKPLPATLRAEEHTAQIERDKAREFQEDFDQGRIHLLSCSTTFELGVDLGDLDTIFLRNAPPEPFNYAQRVGRAGRRIGHPGFAVTYCRRRPHDQAAFDDPAPLMAGKTKPPSLRLTNVKIVSRHVVAVALSAFFRRYPERFETKVEGFLASMAAPSVVPDLERFLRDHRSEIENRLDAIVPGSLKRDTGLEDGTWIEKVTAADTALDRAVAEVADDYQKVEALQRQYIEREEFRGAQWTKRRKATIAGDDVISFLSRKAVIPKYGFPVDVVELDLQRAGSGGARNVSLQRDLSIAVAEFAPEGEVVANKGLWISRGLKRVAGKAWDRFRYRKCTVHGTFETWTEADEPAAPACCSLARGSMWVDPIFGFVAGREGGAEPKARPRRLLTSRPHFSRLAAPEEAPTLLGGVARVWRASPGYLVVLCEGRRGRGFRICSDCGAGCSGAVATSEHDSPTGGSCRGTLESAVLGHQFVTDVLRVRFVREPSHVSPADRLWFRYSLAYALVQGAAEVLEVPRQDLSVTVRAQAHEIVLYDAVPGGAGLVARLEDADLFREALAAACARVAECRGCGPDASCYGCLRHYGNQFAHPRLQRGPAARFLTEMLETWQPTALGADPESVAKERERPVFATPLGLDVDLFPRAWQPLVSDLAAESGVDIDPGGDVAVDGRVIGTYVVELRRAEVSVRVVGARSAAAVAALEREGHRVLALDPADPHAASRVRRLLGLEA